MPIAAHVLGAKAWQEAAPPIEHETQRRAPPGKENQTVDMCESVPRATALVAGTIEGGRLLARRILVHEDAEVENNGTRDAAVRIAGQASSATSTIDYEVQDAGHYTYLSITGTLKQNDAVRINESGSVMLANAQLMDNGVVIENTVNGIYLKNTTGNDVTLDGHAFILL
jgi:autotransporter adhesin